MGMFLERIKEGNAKAPAKCIGPTSLESIKIPPFSSWGLWFTGEHLLLCDLILPLPLLLLLPLLLRFDLGHAAQAAAPTTATATAAAAAPCLI